MKIDKQLTLADIDQEYAAFVEKFKPKKTTDDCYTPPNVYEAVLSWTVKEYGVDPEKVVRPFWPGGDFEKFDYPEGCVVVDNPPFSILSKICKTYMRHGIKFFLFAPYLTNFSTRAAGMCHVITDADVTYENGAIVNTAFVTNLDTMEIRTAPDLRELITREDEKNRREGKRVLPKYEYPDEVATSSMLGYLSKYGIRFAVAPEDCYFVRGLDDQKRMKKSIFGGGYLLSEKAAEEKAAAEKAAAEKAAAEKWKLSDRELEIIRSLGHDKRGSEKSDQGRPDGEHLGEDRGDNDRGEGPRGELHDGRSL